ncbi:hypothetical protein ACP4OV_015907 [Aristida adscensionis]
MAKDNHVDAENPRSHSAENNNDNKDEIFSIFLVHDYQHAAVFDHFETSEAVIKGENMRLQAQASVVMPF